MERDWLTLAELAKEMGVAVSQARLWCIRWRSGKAGGLPYAHAGAKPEEESERINYRVHRDDWEAFKRDRRLGRQKEERRITKLCAAPLDYGGNREASRRQCSPLTKR